MTKWLSIVGLIVATSSWAQSPLEGLTEADVVEGEKLFNVHCARCHGMAGAGGEGSNLAKARLKHASDDETLIEVIDDGIDGTGMPAIWTLNEEQLPKVAAYVRSLGQIEPEEMPGNPDQGARIYQSSGGCPACHIIAGHGIGIGPELTDVGDRRGLAYLRRSLTDPAQSQSQTGGFQDYLTVRATTTDGMVEGMRIDEDAFSIQIRDVAGTIHSLRKDQLVDLEKVFAHSLMPEYGIGIGGQDMDDLVSYLMSLRSDP